MLLVALVTLFSFFRKAELCAVPATEVVLALVSFGTRFWV